MLESLWSNLISADERNDLVPKDIIFHVITLLIHKFMMAKPSGLNLILVDERNDLVPLNNIFLNTIKQKS